MIARNIQRSSDMANAPEICFEDCKRHVLSNQTTDKLFRLMEKGFAKDRTDKGI
jgi:hypothetical protein